MTRTQFVDSPSWTGEALRLVEKLCQEVAAFRASVSEHLEPPDRSDEESSLDAQSALVVLGSNRNRVADIVNHLDEVLERPGFQGEAPLIENWENWGLDTYDLRFNHRVIYNGFLEPVLRRPIVEHLSERIAERFLLSGAAHGAGV